MVKENEIYNKKEKYIESEFYNGFGGFVEDGKEYEIILEGKNSTPAPWINVIANKDFGFQVSEIGGGYTWASNSRENKITPWSNDPVCDPVSEAIYIKDEASGNVITPTSLGEKEKGKYAVRHGFGYTTFSHEEEGIDQKLSVFVPLEESLKIWELKLTNNSNTIRHLSISYFVEWVLGVDKELTGPYIVTSYNNEHEYLYARSIYNYNYRKYNAYMFSSEPITAYTGDRKEFFGEKGSVKEPDGINQKLSCHTGAAYDPCGVIRISVSIMPGEVKTTVFGLGYSDKEEEISKIRNKYKDVVKSGIELGKVKKYWENILGKIQVTTSDRALDILVNGWLLYQTISCRLNARTAFYQCGGAYGYRDQLQDSLALLSTCPERVKELILMASSKQFEEGDVQHWWHPPTGIGVRTRITDDLLWLPYVTAAYIKATQDYTILSEKVSYIKGNLLEKSQSEAMILPEESEVKESVYGHCKKAILHTKMGQHGLPLMGGGDWNDGMNKVGIDGTGESVWLGWFYYNVLDEFLSLCYYEKDFELADQLENQKRDLKEALDKEGWDGEWYLRAYYDDGTKLGSKDCDECKIDSISQSFSVISKGAEAEKATKAIQSAIRHLVVEKEGISLLLAPPFDKTPKNPGYIKKYFPGVRENGGQYTHSAVWLAIACAMIGEKEWASTLFKMMNPIHITGNRTNALKYEREPYVMTADISYSNQSTGRGGWSWYTGSAGWMYQGLIKYFLGIQVEGNTMIIDPSTPENFGDFSVEYQIDETSYHIRIENEKQLEEKGKMYLDGILNQGNRIRLVKDGKVHYVVKKI